MPIILHGLLFIKHQIQNTIIELLKLLLIFIIISVVIQLYQWWKNCNRKCYPSTLYVTLKGIHPPGKVEPAHRSMFAMQEVRVKMNVQSIP